MAMGNDVISKNNSTCIPLEDLVHSFLEDILAANKAKWKEQELVSAKWTVEDMRRLDPWLRITDQ